MLPKSSLLLLGICVFCEMALAQGRIAIVGGTIINVRDGSLVRGAVIVIEGDRIVSVSSGGQAPAGATVVDASGKYVLPGFIDSMRGWKYWAGELFVNHGVTSTGAGASDWARAQKELIENGTILGPRLFLSAGFSGERQPLDVLQRTTVLDRVYINQIVYKNQLPINQGGGSRAEPNPRTANTITSVAEAHEAMKKYVSGKVNVDSVSVNQSVTNAEIVRAIVEDARKANIPVYGHSASARLAADVGYNGLDHTWPVGVSLVDMEAREKAMQKMTKGYIPEPESFMDMKKVPDLAKYMAQRGVYWQPTLRQYWMGAEALLKKDFMKEEIDLFFGDWRLGYIPLDWKLGNIKEFYEIDIWNRRDLTQYERDLYEQGYKNSLYFAKALVDAGGKLSAGTDCASFCVPGLGSHQEMELYVEDVGLTPLQGLQSATIWAAEMMGIQDRLGTIEEGKAADIVILDANPLENIRNTRKIAKVISRGRILDGQYHADFTNPIPDDLGSQTHRDTTSHLFPSPQIDRASLRGATLTVQGTGFIPNYSFVVLNGQKLKTEFIDQFQLKATVPAELLKTGTFPVTVENPNFAVAALRGKPDMLHLEILGNVSNTFLLFFNVR